MPFPEVAVPGNTICLKENPKSQPGEPRRGLRDALAFQPTCGPVLPFCVDQSSRIAAERQERNQ
jgi:hypothetical protein